MPCLSCSSTDQISVAWLHELVLLNPGLQHPPQAELHVSGIVHVQNPPATLRFVHRGHIHTLLNRTKEWHDYASGGEDWLADILNHERLRSYSVDPVSDKPDVLRMRYRPRGNLTEARVRPQEVVVDKKPTTMYVRKDDPESDPLYSHFAVRFEEAGTQLFRIGFLTTYGIRPSSEMQIEVDIEGPARAFDAIQNEAADRVEDAGYRNTIATELTDLYKNRKEQDYDVLVVPHARLSPLVEERDNAPFPDPLRIDLSSAPQGIFAPPCSAARALPFDMNCSDFFVRIVCQLDPNVVLLSPSVQQTLREWRDDGRVREG